MNQKCVLPIVGPQVKKDDVARGVENALCGTVVDEEGVLQSWLAPMGIPSNGGTPCHSLDMTTLRNC